MKTETNITVVWKRVGYSPMVITIPNDLPSMQALVGGYIEPVPFCSETSPALDYITNEEGRLLELVPSVITKEYGSLCGDVFVSALDPERGEQRSLTPEETAEALARLTEESYEP